jgi:nucleotide-binding universal stress UspA family protein
MSSLESIVLATDFSEPSRAAAERACMLAKRTGAKLHLVHSARMPVPPLTHDLAGPGLAWESINEAARKELDALAASIAERGIEVSAEVSESDPVEAIAQAIDQHTAGLVVMGTRGNTGIVQVLLGSVAERTLRGVHGPVMVVKEEPQAAAREIRRILLATDFSSAANAAAEFSVELARSFEAHVDVCHVFTKPTQYYASYDVPPPQDFVDQLRGAAAERVHAVLQSFVDAGVPAESHLITNTPSQAIPSLAEELAADVIVMGTRGTSGVRRMLLGSVAARTVRLARCSVVTVNPAE